MHRPIRFLRVLLAATLLLMLFLAACNRSAAAPGSPAATTAPPTGEIGPTAVVPIETVPVTPTQRPATVLTPTAVAGPTTAQAGETFTSPRYGYTVVLPCCWIALPAPATAVEAALSDLADGTGDPLYDNLLDELRGDDSGVSLEFLAYLPDANGLPAAQLTVSVMPAPQLTLDDYIDSVTAEIGGIGATAVVTGQVEPALGPAGTPASLIEYTTIYEADPLHGLQVAFFTSTGDHLIVLTFTTGAGKYADLEAEFMHIVRSITLDGLDS